MRRPLQALILALLLLALPAGAVHARDAAKDLRQMIGFVVFQAGKVESVTESPQGAKVVKLDNGMVFKCAFLVPEPLPSTDVIVFARRHPQEVLAQQTPGIYLPEHKKYAFKLLIDNRAFDAKFVKW